MPIYEFECETCRTRFDRLQKLSDPDPTACPSCPTPKIRRRVTAPSFRLSGSGWYETDFKKDSDKKRNLVGKDEAPKSAEPKSETKADTKTESKPAAGSAPSSSSPPAATS